MKKRHKLGALEQRVAFLCVLLFVAFIALFSKLPERIAAMEKKRQFDGEFYEFSQLFSEIYNDISDRYVEEVDGNKLFAGAIRGMFATLDPHSSWLPPDALQSLERDTEGEFSGVGLHIGMKNGILTVIAPIPASPAARAGVLPWDQIHYIDDESTEGITLLEAVKKLTGPTGTKVVIKVYRSGETELLEMELKRDTIKIDSVFSKILDNGIGYLRLTKWAESTAGDTKKILKEFNKNDVKALVVDLRYNSGGLLDSVVEVCDFFLEKDQLIVSTKGRKSGNTRTYKSLENPITDLPLIVLVNRGSASASEIFAGAMQDTNRGFILGPEGQNTYGKGSVQTISYLKHSMGRTESGEPSQSGIRLTTAHYYTPAGRMIHGTGIEPDFKVEVTMEQQRKLLIRGFIGDPDTSGLSDDEGEDEDKSAEEAEEAEEEEEVHDVELEEAIKYLRLMLSLQQRMTASM